MVMVRDLYGLKSSEASWRLFLQRHCAIRILCRQWLIQTFIVDKQGSLMVKITMNYYNYMWMMYYAVCIKFI